MSNDRIVINASPLITLCKSDQEDILPQLFNEIVVPHAVWAEVIAGGHDEAARKLPLLSYVRREQLSDVAPAIQAWDLGAGESEVLSFALHQPEYLAIVDDNAARVCARSLQINSLGTVGLFVLAKRRKLLSEVMPCIQRLRDADLWLSDRIIEAVKQQAGE